MLARRSPPTPTSDVTDAIRRCSRDEVGEVVVEERRADAVPHDAADLDLVHREDHPGRRAGSAELEAGVPRARRTRRPRRRASGHVRATGRRLPVARRRASCGKRASRSTIVGCCGGDRVGDPADAVEEGLRRGRPSRSRRSLAGELLERVADRRDALEDAARSIRSGNSTSNSFSSASIRLTLACEVMPAAYRSCGVARDRVRRRGVARDSASTCPDAVFHLASPSSPVAVPLPRQRTTAVA